MKRNKNEGGQIIRFPSRYKLYNKDAEKQGKSIAKCEISGRFLEAAICGVKNRHSTDPSHYVHIDVMTWDSNDPFKEVSKPRKLCELILDSNDILKIADKIRANSKNTK